MFKYLISFAFLILASVGGLTGAASADPVIDRAKAEGVIGERADGYLGFVQSSSPGDDLSARVAEVNAKRREVYTRLSQQTGESLAVIAALTAEKQVQKAAPGEYVMTASGVWVRK